MALLNKVILTGYVGSGMKVKAGGDGSGYTAFRILVSERKKPSDNKFFSVFLNERIKVNFREGDYVYIEGELSVRTKEMYGRPVSVYYVNGYRVVNLGIKNNEEL